MKNGMVLLFSGTLNNFLKAAPPIGMNMARLVDSKGARIVIYFKVKGVEKKALGLVNNFKIVKII